MTTLQQHISRLVHTMLDRYPGSWMVWCDPRGDWGPILQRVAEQSGTQGFSLLSITELTAGELGGPQSRRMVQERIKAGESFVLHVTASPDHLGWLWAQALLAECIYGRSLREQLLEWGWRPQSIRTGEDEVAVLARQYLQEDPSEWGGGGLQPNANLLLEILASGSSVDADDRMVLDLTIEQAGLPKLDEQNIPRWRIYALVWLLVTQAYSVAPDAVGAGHDYLIAADKRAFALDLLERWLDSRSLSNGLPEAILEADHIAGLGHAGEETALTHEPFLSYAAEHALFARTCYQLAEQSGRALLETFASLTSALQRHATSFWGNESEQTHPRALAWGELARLASAVQLLLAASPLKDWANPNEAIAWYTQQGWRVDKAGEELLRNLNKTTPELLAFIAPLRAAYRARWEDSLMQWSALWESAGCPVPALQTAGEWAAKLLKGSGRATAIIVADALRYDLGAILAAQLNKSEGAERATVQAARTALPSITALGMGLALPLSEKDLQADIIDGKWQLHQKGHSANLSIAEQRREWLRTQGKVTPDALLSMEQVQNGAIPRPNAQRNRLVIADDLIDKLGHDEELESMGTEQVMKRYLDAIQRLRDTGWLRILVVTDHGFIHWPGSNEHHVSPPVPDPVYSSRRALAYPESVTISGPQGLAPGGKWRIAVPNGAACFRAYGGLGYFHGGASLQEWIIPCLSIEWPQKVSPVKVAIQSIEQILSLRPKIMLEVVREHMFTEDAIPRQVEVRLRDAHTKTILFSSAPKTITPDQDEVAVVLEALENVQAERGTKLFIEVRDPHSDEIIATKPTTLMVPLENW